MKRSIFLTLYFLSPVIPAALYLSSVSGGLDGYSLSVALGVYAFVTICNQLILASRPGFAVSALGRKGVLKLHSFMPFAILAMAGVHKLLKAANGYPEETLQATFGAVAWWIFAAAAILALLLMATINLPIAARLRELRAFVAASLKLDYKTARLFHNVTVAAALCVMVHALLATSSAFAGNPVGIAWLAAWMLLSLGTYGRYRAMGRRIAKAADKA